jgi:hypothetical protein
MVTFSSVVLACGVFGVGARRVVAQPRLCTPGERLFTFVGYGHLG